jgi:hypothetical protein
MISTRPIDSYFLRGSTTVVADQAPSLFDGYDVSADGRFLLLEPAEEHTSRKGLMIVQNWFSEFQQKGG